MTINKIKYKVNSPIISSINTIVQQLLLGQIIIFEDLFNSKQLKNFAFVIGRNFFINPIINNSIY